MEGTQPKPFVFVLMPFDEAFRDIYLVGIKTACKDAGAYCERVDEQIFEESILGRIYNQIAKADIIVADMTNRNANVFYETGYAHALGKRVILLTQKAEDIPFDLKHYPHIVYGGKIADLKDQLERRIKWCIEHPKESLARLELNIQLFIASIRLTDKPEIPYAIRRESDDEAYLKLDIYNPGNRMQPRGAFKVGVVTPPKFDSSEKSDKVIQLPENLYLHIFPEVGSIFPRSWESTEIKLLSSDLFHLNEAYEMVVRVFTEIEAFSFPFTMKVARA
jgi:hypothetical protein